MKVAAYRAIPGPLALPLAIVSALVSLALVALLAALGAVIIAVVLVLTPLYFLGRHEERRRAHLDQQAMMSLSEPNQEER